jgi:hypothetical protein
MGREQLFSIAILGTLLGLAGCSGTPVADPPLEIKILQSWELQPGDSIQGYTVLGGLGDISIALNGHAVYAPFAGTARRDPRNCLLLSSPEVPAYLFRFCGLNQPRYGAVEPGESIGTATQLQFAALRKQADGTWAIVEPSKQILERTLTRS